MKILISLILLNLAALQVFCQDVKFDISNLNDPVEVEYKYSIYTTYLSLVNFGKPETNTQHYEIQFAYQLTQKDRIGVKAATWKLFAPMGIPIWHDQFLNRESFYLGRLRETGLGLTYQRKIWKDLFAAIEVLPLMTEYIDDEQNNIAKGFKLYNSYHLGYHIPLFKKGRVFIEPQLHVNHWMINTDVPQAFKNEEDKWNNFF